MTHAARISTGRPGGEQLFTLENDDVADAAAREVVGDARAHTAAANHYRVGGWFHAQHAGFEPIENSNVGSSQPN